MKLNTVLIEDNPEHLLILESLIKKNCNHINVVAVCHNLKEAKKQIEKYSPHLILSDISLPGEDVFEFFDDVEDKFFSVVFITAYQDFAIKALKMHAADYLLKPYTGSELVEMENRILKTIELKNNNISGGSNDVKGFITIRLSQRTLKVKLNDIIMLHAQQSYTDIHLMNGEVITASRNIKHFETEVSSDTFFRTHKSYLINMNHFREMDTSDEFLVLLAKDKKAAISRRVLPKFNSMLKELIG